ncbi:MAG: phage tail tape measure protein [Pseudomonadota bacterium]
MSDYGDANAQLAQATDVVAAFNSELGQLQETVTRTQYDVGTLEKGLSTGLRRAIDGVVLDGRGLSDAFKSLGMTMANMAYDAAMKPVTAQLGRMMGGLVDSIMPFADGGVISQGRVVPFAKGGVVGGPTTFPMSGATGLMGEAGPEAIMPLTRGADGRLGVAAQGGRGGVNITMNIQTPDVASFQRSQSQIAASMQRAMSRGGRNT